MTDKPTPVADRQRNYTQYPQPRPRMTDAQVLALYKRCVQYGVIFREDDYYTDSSLPPGYFTGWIGGWRPGSDRKKTICVGVSPEGRVSS